MQKKRIIKIIKTVYEPLNISKTIFIRVQRGNHLSSNLPVVYDSKQISSDVDVFSKGLTSYLHFLNLPTEHVLVEIKERGKVIANMPWIVENLSAPQRERAFYISKFIASCSVGLFDAALNYLWNETIVNLRQKVIRFDLDYFYDSIIGDSDKRSKFKNEDDLKKLDDWELIRGCLKTGIITDIGYRHLDYIRDMRNFASAAHPNHTELTGLQVVSWLETCIKEVLAKEPSGPVLEIRKLLQSIREQTLTETDSKPIILNVQQLPQDLVHSLLRTIFGMYTDEKLDVNVRNNINLFAKAVWIRSDDSAKNEIGLKYAIFSANAEIKRKELAKQFLDIVDGLGYLTEDQRAIEMKECLETLLTAHYNYNNFSNEEPHTRILLKYVPKTGIIPKAIRSYYVKVLLICKLGNMYGVSFVAEPYYNTMIKRFQDTEIKEFLELLKDKELISLFQIPERANKFKQIAKYLLENNTKNEVLKQALDIIVEGSIKDLQTTRAYLNVKDIIL